MNQQIEDLDKAIAMRENDTKSLLSFIAGEMKIYKKCNAYDKKQLNADIAKYRLEIEFNNKEIEILKRQKARLILQSKGEAA